MPFIRPVPDAPAPRSGPQSGDILEIRAITGALRIADGGSAARAPHALHHFVYLAEGNGVFVTQDKVHALRSGDLVNIPIALTYTLDLGPQARGWLMTVAVHELPEVMRMSVANPTRLAFPFTLPAPDPVPALLEQISGEAAGSALFRTAVLRALATQFSVIIVRAAEDIPRDLAGNARSKYLPRILPIVRQYIHARLSVADYAAKIGISPIHFNRLCRKLMHCSAHELIENIRTQEACHLLTTSDKSISQIGFDLGFEEPSYFSRAFRRATGETPSAYRNARRDVR